MSPARQSAPVREEVIAEPVEEEATPAPEPVEVADAVVEEEPEYVPEPIRLYSEDDVTLPDGRVMSATEYKERLALLTKPFRTDEIEKLPKPVKRDDKDLGYCRRGSNYSADGYFCGKRHARSVHLDYVGHAGITDRLNQVDPLWNWEPMAVTEDGTPKGTDGGMWGKLTVLGITRIGFGDPGKSNGPNAIKETIGDFLRNAGMRFGIGTYLWSKSALAEQKKLGELEVQEETAYEPPTQHPTSQGQPPTEHPQQPDWQALINESANNRDMLLDLLQKAQRMHADQQVIAAIQETGMALDARTVGEP